MFSLGRFKIGKLLVIFMFFFFIWLIIIFIVLVLLVIGLIRINELYDLFFWYGLKNSFLVVVNIICVILFKDKKGIDECFIVLIFILYFMLLICVWLIFVVCLIKNDLLIFIGFLFIYINIVLKLWFIIGKLFGWINIFFFEIFILFLSVSVIDCGGKV